MKTLKVILVIMAFAQLSLAQVPKTFNYQAVARDENGLTLADQNIVVEISVRQASTSGTIAWQEVHYTQTNAFGLFTIEIGGSSGIQTEAGSASSFDAIDWSDNIYYIQTRVDFGKSEFINGFIDMGTVKLTSVPYAFIADSALNVAIPTLTEVLGMNQTALSINDVPKWDGSNWIVGSAGVAGNYITDDGTTDLIGDWTISSNSITLTSGNIGLTNGNLSLSNGILSTPALTMGGTTFTSVSSDLNSNSTASAIVTAEAVKTYVDNNIGVSYWSLNTGTIYNATNYIGIGTTLPTERLHVDLLNDETVLITGTFQLTGHVVNRGAGTRFEFSPAKGALRAGGIDGTQWDDANVGQYSVAFGLNTSATGHYSFAAGESNTASGIYSIAMGSNNIALNSKSVALGQNNTAAGVSSVALNESNSANGAYSMAIGYTNIANGDESLAIGLNTITDAGANGSLAAGFGSQTYGMYSAAFGESSQTNSSAQSSFAGGKSSLTYGMYSFAFGDNLSASAYSEFAIGRYNTFATLAPTRDAWVLQDRVFVVGIGVDPTARENAMVILKNGNVGIGVDNPTVALAVTGNITATGAITGSSDIRFKKNISKINAPLSKVNRLNGVYYDWRINEFPDKKFSEKRQIGLIAQDVEKIVPEVVLTDGEGYKSIDYAKLNALLIEAIKEQQREIEILKKNQGILMKMIKK